MLKWLCYWFAEVQDHWRMRASIREMKKMVRKLEENEKRIDALIKELGLEIEE